MNSKPLIGHLFVEELAEVNIFQHFADPFRTVAVTVGVFTGLERRSELAVMERALDRLLISGFYVVPLFHLPDQWVARWTSIEYPKTTPLFGYLPEAWWRKPGAP